MWFQSIPCVVNVNELTYVYVDSAYGIIGMDGIEIAQNAGSYK